MPDFEKLLLQEQLNPNATILQFFLSNYAAEDVVVVVEGPDDPTFYYDFIETYIPNQKYFFFPCGGKSALLKFKDFIARYALNPAPKKLLFLTDKDFDDFLGRAPSDIFQTEHYSIENYFCTPEFFEYLLRRHGAGNIRTSRIPALTAQFSELLESAAKDLLIPMAFICALREREAAMDLDRINCSDFFEVAPEGGMLRRKRRRREALQKTFLKADEVYELKCASTRNFIRKFLQSDHNTWLRGKYALQLMRLLVRSLGHSHPSLSEFLHRLGSAFGGDCFRYAKLFLGDIPSLQTYCAD